jgi:hypothetical protein
MRFPAVWATRARETHPSVRGRPRHPRRRRGSSGKRLVGHRPGLLPKNGRRDGAVTDWGQSERLPGRPGHNNRRRRLCRSGPLPAGYARPLAPRRAGAPALPPVSGEAPVHHAAPPRPAAGPDGNRLLPGGGVRQEASHPRSGRWHALEWLAPWGSCWIVPLYHPSPVNGGRWRRNKLYLQRFLTERSDSEALPVRETPNLFPGRCI